MNRDYGNIPCMQFDKSEPNGDISFLRDLLGRCGYEVMPRGVRVPSEMHALMNWFHGERDEESPFAQLQVGRPQ